MAWADQVRSSDQKRSGGNGKIYSISGVSRETNLVWSTGAFVVNALAATGIFIKPHCVGITVMFLDDTAAGTSGVIHNLYLNIARRRMADPIHSVLDFLLCSELTVPDIRVKPLTGATTAMQLYEAWLVKPVSRRVELDSGKIRGACAPRESQRNCCCIGRSCRKSTWNFSTVNQIKVMLRSLVGNTDKWTMYRRIPNHRPGLVCWFKSGGYKIFSLVLQDMISMFFIWFLRK